MTWDYARDQRTDKEVLSHFKKGKEMEEKIIGKLESYTDVHRIASERDSFKKLSKYRPDIKMRYRGIMREVEIKYTDKDLRAVDLKSNQYEYLKQCKGLDLQVAGKKCCVIDVATEPHRDVDKSYCNKPAKRFIPQWRYSFEALFV